MISRHKTYGLALPEVLVSLSLIAMSALSVTLAGAHAIASSYTASRQHAAWRLTSELSAWLNARGHLALDKLPEDPSELIDKNSAVPDCYAQTCTAQDAARFFLIHERVV